MPVTVERKYKAVSSTPQAARTSVAELLRAWEAGSDETDIACLLTSEVVSNAVIHAGGEIGLRLTLAPPVLVVEVSDSSPALPHRLPLSPESERGRGLFVVEALSRRWGAHRRPGGKVVWFEVLVSADEAVPELIDIGPRLAS